jgi:hypothetical protein
VLVRVPCEHQAVRACAPTAAGVEGRRGVGDSATRGAVTGEWG